MLIDLSLDLFIYTLAYIRTCGALPSPLSTEESRSERSAKNVCDVKFWRIKDVSFNNIFPACIERRVNFSYTWCCSWKTENSSLLKDNAIPVTPHLNDWYIKHAESSGRTLGKERSKTKTTHPKTKKEKYVAHYSNIQHSWTTLKSSLSRKRQLWKEWAKISANRLIYTSTWLVYEFTAILCYFAAATWIYFCISVISQQCLTSQKWAFLSFSILKLFQRGSWSHRLL